MKKRLDLLDSIRGVLLLNMIAYHTLWDMVYLFGFRAPWYRATPGAVWQTLICSSFLLLSGYCWSLGTHHVRRGLTVFGAGVLVTAATMIAMLGAAVIFGVLTLIGTGMLALIPLSRLFEKLPALPALLVCTLLAVLGYTVPDGSFVGIALPSWLYRNYLSTYLGFPFLGFSSADYFPVIPWIFVVFCGYFLHRLVHTRFAASRIATMGVAPLNFLGRHCLLFYLLHQPIIYGVLMLIYAN